MKKTKLFIIIVLILILIIIFIKRFSLSSLKKDTNIQVSTTTQISNIDTSINTSVNNIDMKDWIVTSTNGYSFKYPKDFSTQYISMVNWPPTLKLKDEAFICKVNDKSDNIAIGQVVSKMINGKEFCITKESEGAAGSVYTDYTYSFSYKENTLNMSFTLRAPQCMNYDNPAQTLCTNEEQSFNPDNILSAIANTVN